MNAEPTHAVVLTPPGLGAVATVLVSGPDAAAWLDQLLLPLAPRRAPFATPGRIWFGRWQRAEGEEVVVGCLAADRFEVHCHGGRAAVAALMESLVERGAVELRWEHSIRREAPDTIAAEATIARAAAPSLRTAAILLDQQQGALRNELLTIQNLIGRGDWLESERRLETLLARAPVGRHLTEPWKVVLTGRPNVGKSSLINALVGYERAIVSSTPGTTRDYVTARTAVEGWPIELTDTAGLRETDDPLELAGVALTRSRAAGADVVILVSDASEAWTETDAQLWQAFSTARAPALLVHNKSDAWRDDAGRPDGLRLSATTSENLDALLSAIVCTLVPIAPPPGAAAPFTSRQLDALRSALDFIQARDPQSAAALSACIAGS